MTSWHCCVVLLAVAFFGSSINLADASHFAYGSVTWERAAATGVKYNIYTEFAFRYNYWGTPYIGVVYNCGSMETTTVGRSTVHQTQDIKISVKEINVPDAFLTGWWNGVQTFNYANSGPLYQLQYSDNARLNSLMNGNGGKSWTLNTILNINVRKSPTVQGLPRYYVALNQPMQWSAYANPSVGESLFYRWSRTGESSLNQDRPSDNSGTAVLDTKTGQVAWTPRTAGLYAFQIMIYSGSVSSPTVQVPLDVTVQVMADCGTKCVKIYFVPEVAFSAYFFVGVERSFIIEARSANPSDKITLSNNVLPDGSSFAMATQSTGGGTEAWVKYQFTWTPNLGSTSKFICVQALTSSGFHSLGNYCVNCLIGAASIIYVSGVVRDFKPNAPASFGVTDDASPAPAFVQSTLGSDGLPAFNAAVTSRVTATDFNWWFRTDFSATPINKQTVLSTSLSNGTHSNNGVLDPAIFTFFQSNYWPIDGQLFDFDATRTTTAPNNRYFTYEIHTYVTYKGGEVFNFKSADDLWVFVDRKLPDNWNLQGVHAMTSASIALNGFTGQSGKLVIGNTYRVDIFYAHRSSSRNPALQLELSAASLCNALSSGTVSINIPAAGFSAASVRSKLITAGGASAVLYTNGNLNLGNNVPNSASAVWWSADASTGKADALEILHGFSSEFRFTATAGAEGFAFVMQKAGSTAIGTEGQNLGYGTMKSSIAVELDMKVSASDPNYQHVSIHTRLGAENDASEVYSIGSSKNNPAMTMTNGTSHYVRVEYVPGQDEASGPSLGWIRVYMNENIAPVCEAQVDGAALARMFGGDAFIGFTASNGDTAATYTITEWKVVVVPASAAATTAVVPTSVEAGAVSTTVIQSMDSCANKIKAGGAASQFTVVLTKASGVAATVPTTIVDNNDGTYSVNYVFTLVGPYRMVILFQGNSISGSPWQDARGISVRAGPADASKTTFSFGRLPVRPSNVPVNSASTNCLFIVWFDPNTGAVRPGPAGQTTGMLFDMTGQAAFSGNAAAFSTQVAAIAKNDIVAVVAIGDVSAAIAGASTALTSIGATRFTSASASASYAVIGIKGGAMQKESLVTTGPSDALSASFSKTAKFVITAQGSATNYGAFGQINSKLATQTFVAKSTGVVTIIARDAWGNQLVNRLADPVPVISFAPSITGDGGTIVDPALWSNLVDGYYDAKFTALKTGSYQLYVRLGSTDVAGSPTTVVILPNQAFGPNCVASGNGLTLATAGVDGSFLLQLKDADNNLITQANVDMPDTVTCTLTMGSTSVPTTYDLATQSIRYKGTDLTKAGTYTINIVVNGRAVPVSSNLVVVATDVDAASSICFKDAIGTPPPATAIAGVQTFFYVQARDKFQNLRLVANDKDFTITFNPALSSPATSSIRYDSVGRYLVTYIPTVTTTSLKIAVAYSGTNVAPGEMTVAVSAGAADVLSTLGAPNSLSVKAGSKSLTASITSLDAYSNARNGAVSTDYLGKFVLAGTTTESAKPVITAAAANSNVLSMSLYAELVGVYDVFVTLISTGAAIANSGLPAYKVTIIPDATDFTKSTYPDIGKACVQGKTTTFTVQARDKYSNAAVTTNDNFEVQQDASAKAACTNSSPGLYKCTFTCPVTSSSPTTTIKVFGAGTQINSVSMTLTPDLSTSYARVLNMPTSTPAGLTSPVKFVIQDYDRIKKLPSTAPYTQTSFTCRTSLISGGVTYAPDCTVTPRSDPTVSIYDAQFSTTKAGIYQIFIFELGIFPTSETTATVDGFSRVTANVVAGAVDPNRATVTLSSTSITAGTTGTVVVTLSDTNQNPIITGTNVLSLSIDGQIFKSSVWSSATKSYTLSYQLNVAGLKTITAFESSQPSTPLSGSTFTVNVIPGGPSAAYSSASGDGLKSGVAGQKGFFDIVIKDKFYNPARQGDLAASRLTFNFVPQDVAGTATAVAVTASYVASADKYFATYTPTVSGAYSASVLLDGLHIIGSPFTFSVDAAAISDKVSQSTNAAKVIAAGQNYTFTYNAKDAFGNPWRSGAYLIRALAKLASGELVDCGVTSQPGGVYLVRLDGRFTTEAAKGYAFDIVADGSQLPRGAHTPTFDVMSGPCDSAMTLIAPFTTSLSGGKTSVNTDESLTFTTMDRFGNVRSDQAVHDDLIEVWFVDKSTDCDDADLDSTPPAIQTTFKYAKSSPAPNKGLATYVTTGITSGSDYKATFSAARTGFFYLAVTVNGGKVACTTVKPILLQVAPGEPTAATSIYAGDTNTTAGVPFELEVIVADSQKNLLNRRGMAVDNEFNIILGCDAATCNDDASKTFWSSADTSLKTLGGVKSINATDFTAAVHLLTTPIPLDTTVLSYTNWQRIYDGTSMTFKLTGTATAAGKYNLVVHLAGVMIPGNHVFTVLATTALKPKLVTAPGVVVAGQPSSFTFSALDNYDNPVSTSGHSFSAFFKQTGRSYAFSGVAQQLGGGKHAIQFVSSWSGNFTVSVKLIEAQAIKDPNYFNNGGELTLSLEVIHATCAVTTSGTKNFRCAVDGKCVAAYSDCTPETYCPAGQVICGPKSGGGVECAASRDQCMAPTGLSVPCNGYYVATVADCPLIPQCPIGTVPCDTSPKISPGECRKTLDECPSTAVCTPGYTMCPTGCTLNSVVAASGCDMTPFTSPCPANAPGNKKCADGRCVRMIEDCSTPPTCKDATFVVCPDGSCAASPTVCPQVMNCAAPSIFRCFDGSCRSTSSQCPSGITCPAGWVMCENKRCVSTIAECQTPADCGYAKVRCPNGACMENLLHCASLVTCPTNKPILCTDGSCQATSYECNTPRACTSPAYTCLDGSCVGAPSLCPNPKSCPSSTPILCADGSCVASTSECNDIPSCPTNSPLRCPDGSCRSNLQDCPSIAACPFNFPIRCQDGRCVEAVDRCPATSVLACAADEVRCPGGECAKSTTLCPTHSTCSWVAGSSPLVMSVKCLDGSCRPNCNSVSYSPCPQDQVQCPMAGSGLACASDLSQCPQSVICPAATPIRCMDMHCVVTFSDCPQTPSEVNTMFACADGTWRVDPQLCGTVSTCPASVPYKCWDDTCRLAPSDCPATPPCPPATPFLCQNGKCVKLPWDGECTSISTPCSPSTPVRCPTGTCVLSIDLCPNPFIKTDVPESTFCPAKANVRCRDGSCKESQSDCPILGCPVYLPYICPSGLCATSVAKCPSAYNGCPWDLAIKCWNGKCVANEETDCPQQTKASACPLNRRVECPDGSCAPSALACPNANGCKNDEVLCLDRRCVKKPEDPKDLTPCLAGTSAANACPGSRPFRCINGYCALSSTTCPSIAGAGSYKCPANKPAECADGSCAPAAEQCPNIAPCSSGQERCPDASCRAPGSCPRYNSCPLDFSFRCPNGLCATDALSCIDDATGCPANKPVKCDSGACASFDSECSQYQFTNDGCPVGKSKCWNGECVVKQEQCPFANGCPATAPFRCASSDNACVALPTDCNTGPRSTGPYKCADGTLVDTASKCLALNGCPLTKPFRCGDGSCSALPAAAGGCNVALSCPNKLDTMCFDGSCVSFSSFCLPKPVCSGDAATLCPDSRLCAVDLKSCPQKSAVCPSASPVLCSNGLCKASVGSCPKSNDPSSTAVSKCDKTTPFECFDGSCKAKALDCITWTASSGATPSGGGQAISEGTDVTDLCGKNMVVCSDGSCMPNVNFCDVTPACGPKMLRCRDGTCVAEGGECLKVKECESGKRCPDGSCRTACIPFNGCSVELPFQCNNGECVAAGRENDCDGMPFRVTVHSASSADPTIVYEPSINAVAARRLLADSVSPCFETAAGCYSTVSVSRVAYTVDISQTKLVDIAIDKAGITHGQVTVPSGALGRKDGGSSTMLTIRPVADSRIRNSVNHLPTTRWGNFRNVAYFSKAATVLSPPFECSVDAGVQEPFAVNLTYTASIDLQTAMGSILQYDKYDDVCLASLKKFDREKLSYWQCLHSTEAARRANPVRPANSNNPARMVSSVLNSCGQGTVWAFIHSPINVGAASTQYTSFAQDHMIAIIFGMLGGLAFVSFSIYALLRLYRFKKKLHVEREAVAKKKEEVEDMERFGGAAGNKDEEITLTSNPMVQQLKDMKEMEKKLSSKELEMEKAKQEERAAASEVRRQQIQAMEEERNKMARELEEMRKRAKAQEKATQAAPSAYETQYATAGAPSGPTATYAPATAPQPVRQDFAAAPAARKRKDL